MSTSTVAQASASKAFLQAKQDLAVAEQLTLRLNDALGYATSARMKLTERHAHANPTTVAAARLLEDLLSADIMRAEADRLAKGQAAAAAWALVK